MKDKFMAAAQEFETGQTGKTFLKSLKKIATHKPEGKK
jgi:hypothetical protein